MSTPTRIISSAGNERQCHICGNVYSKASLPSHQRNCIKKSFNLHPARSIMSAGAYGTSMHQCASCMNKFPQHKMMSHLRICNGKSARMDFKSFIQESEKYESFQNVSSQNRPSKTAGFRNSGYSSVEIDDSFTNLSIHDKSIEKYPIETPNYQEETINSLLSQEVVAIVPNLPCSICNRKFLEQDRLDKHMQACAKSQKPRKVFDTTKARVQGTDMEKYVNMPQKKIKLKKSNWRENHENFIQALRAPSGTGGTSMPVVNSDYVECMYCQRTFNEDAAGRHIPICKKAVEASRRNSKNRKK